LGTLGGSNAEPDASNAAGVIVGTSDTASGIFHAFLWEDGTMIDLDPSGENFSIAVAVNSRKQAVGTVFGASSNQAAYWEDGMLTVLPSLGGDDSAAIAISERGEIIGYSKTPTGETHAVMWVH
jgi:probable HAF family extracellular repeat protein